MQTSNETPIIYEQPLNEHVRFCLRLEHLLKQAYANISKTTDWHHRLTIKALIEVLNVIDRPDLKTKLIQALTQHAYRLTQLEKNPQVDKRKLQAILNEIDTFINELYANQTRIGESLRSNVFLETIRQHLHTPGGPCHFNTPAYHLWLQQPIEKRISALTQWLNEFQQLYNIVALLLQLTRENGRLAGKLAINGFFQETLESSNNYQMIRVAVSPANLIYPAFSVGPRRLTIHFLNLNIYGKERDPQAKHSVCFQLACCYL